MAPRKRKPDVTSPLKAGSAEVLDTVAKGVKGKARKTLGKNAASKGTVKTGVASDATENAGKTAKSAKKAKVANDATPKAAPKTSSKRTKAAIPKPEKEPEPKRAKYERRFADLARRMFLAKVPDDEIADFFGIETEEMEWWKEEHPEFADAFRRDQRDYGGRPSEFDERNIAIAELLASLGATDLEIAQAFEVSIRTIYRWKLEYPQFREALTLGKEAADAKVEDSLYKRATGYSFDSEKIVVVEGEPQRVEIIEHVPPDTKAAMWWLQNRRPGIWRDVRHIKHDVEKDSELGSFLRQIGGKAFSPADQDGPANSEPGTGATAFAPSDDEQEPDVRAP